MTNEDKITIEPEIRINGRFCLHDLESGEEVWQEDEIFDSVEERKGKTYICYYTGGNYEGYYVRESKEEVIALVNEARDKISEAYKKYKIVETVQEEKQEDDIDLELEDFCPRTLLTDKEIEQARKIAEEAMLESVKYIFSVIKKDGYGLKGAKTYFDLYIDKRNKEMENEKKAKELASKYARQYHHNTYPESSSNGEFVFSNEEIEKACLEMAEWKDKQFGEEKKKLVEKLSKWILENKYFEVYCSATRFVEDLKNIMEVE